MNQPKPKRVVKTLSIRIPEELYLEASQWGIDKSHPSLNAAIIELINTGLKSMQEKDRIVSQFILEYVSTEKLKELIDGTVKT